MIFNQIYPGRRSNIRACSQEAKPLFSPCVHISQIFMNNPLQRLSNHRQDPEYQDTNFLERNDRRKGGSEYKIKAIERNTDILNKTTNLKKHKEPKLVKYVKQTN